MNALDVLLHEDRVGRLERAEQGRLRFRYLDSWIGAEGAPLSLSLPVRSEPFENDDSRPFFGGLLPEGDFLRAVARAFGVSATNPFAVLAAIGGECAGAVSLARVDAEPPTSRAPHWLDASELHQLITDLPRRPLLAGGGEDGLRLSLAGVQDKLPVIFGGGRVGITRGSPPSTHIIKLPDTRFEDMVANEAYCLAIATHAGLDVVDAGARIATGHGSFEPREDDKQYLLVWRYDRLDPEGRGITPASAATYLYPAHARRIHQEDLCQALGVVAEDKYEADGGPGIAACAELIRQHAAAPAVDLLAFVDAVLFNFLIGNHDAHSKNFSLLLEGERARRLSPLYDLISTAAYQGLSRKMAMKIGGEYRPEWVRGRHLERMATDLGMSGPAVRERAEALCDRVLSAREAAATELGSPFEDRPIVRRIHDLISDRVGLLRAACAELVTAR